MVDWDIKVPNPSTTGDNSTTNDDTNVPKTSEADIEAKINKAMECQSDDLNCLFLGRDGSGKSGLAIYHVSKLPKKTLIIDLDGGDIPLKNAYYPDNKNIIVVNPLVVEWDNTGKSSVNYRKTISEIQAYILYVKVHSSEFSAIIIDGLSSLLKDAEYLMRLEKNMTASGDVSYRYWKDRNKTFIEVLEMMKSIQGVDKLYIGHEDFDVPETVKGGDPKDKPSSIKMKTNQMIHQRILTRKEEKDGRVLFIAKIDKSKYNINLEGKEFTFGTVDNGVSVWNPDPIFKGLKGEKK